MLSPAIVLRKLGVVNSFKPPCIYAIWWLELELFLPLQKCLFLPACWHSITTYNLEACQCFHECALCTVFSWMCSTIELMLRLKYEQCTVVYLAYCTTHFLLLCLQWPYNDLLWVYYIVMHLFRLFFHLRFILCPFFSCGSDMIGSTNLCKQSCPNGMKKLDSVFVLTCI
jgi:hypothetical protein